MVAQMSDIVACYLISLLSWGVRFNVQGFSEGISILLRMNARRLIWGLMLLQDFINSMNGLTIWLFWTWVTLEHILHGGGETLGRGFKLPDWIAFWLITSGVIFFCILRFFIWKGFFLTTVLYFFDLVVLLATLPLQVSVSVSMVATPFLP
ncbi:hypothetical protein JCGZ_24337 [Jatropha curcas]|uniref:Uncharacterized protein n=1 Tax=Jatropha curcas TaxID=180498 RepID=A0A067L5P8_JATCU|nr:hypothetical protein JCGZ_24337 [Jatropha curcas]